MSADELHSAKARVAEFIRQWAMAKDKTDLIYGVHFDPNVDDGAELRASDLATIVTEGA